MMKERCDLDRWLSVMGDDGVQGSAVVSSVFEFSGWGLEVLRCSMVARSSDPQRRDVHHGLQNVDVVFVDVGDLLRACGQSSQFSSGLFGVLRRVKS